MMVPEYIIFIHVTSMAYISFSAYTGNILFIHGAVDS